MNPSTFPRLMTSLLAQSDRFFIGVSVICGAPDDTFMNMTKSNKSLYRRLQAVLCAAPVLFFSGTSGAQEWRFQPEVRVGAEYDDNSRLSTVPAFVQTSDGYLIGASLEMRYATERTTFSVSPRILSRNYNEIPDIDSNDQFVDLNFNRKFLKGNLGIRADFAKESVRTAERTEPDLDEEDPSLITDDDIGLVFTSGDRDRFSITPQWNYDIGQRTSLVLGAEYLDVGYSGAAVNSFVDYSDARFEGALSRRISERTSAYFGVGVRQFDNKASNDDYDGIAASMGMQSNLSETVRLQAEIGYEEANLESTGQSDSAVVGNISLVRSLETVTYLLRFSRSVSPGGNGRVSERDSFNLNIRKKFTERVSGSVGLRSTSTDDIVNTAQSIGGRDLLQLSAQLKVAISRAFTVEANYRYNDIERPADGGSADSNSITLWLVYRPTAIVK